ncbi:MAG: response regulator [Bryobacteraceae bacterium]
MIAEDDDQLCAYMVEVLTEVGYQVVPACNGKEAVSALRRRHVDLLVTDLIMPDQEGLEVILYVRKHFPNLKVIAMSGGLDAYLRAARCLGAHVMLHKPFSAGDLVRTVVCLCGPGLQPGKGTPGTERDPSSPELSAAALANINETEPECD